MTLPLPGWFKQPRSKYQATRVLEEKLDGLAPNSICQEARCPNRSDCFQKGVMTFMILGTVCTRNCAFCSVMHGTPLPADLAEIEQVVGAVERLNLRFVVLTSPNRDDLPDGGASHYARMIRAIKGRFPDVKVEVLIPDFQGQQGPLEVVLAAGPDVLNHNLETVPSLYRTIRRGSEYDRSLTLLKRVKDYNLPILTKTGLMMGLGETPEEVAMVFQDIYRMKVDVLTLGQYLKPDRQSADVQKYYTPSEFDVLKQWAETAGIRYVFSGPLVRSSYLAEHVFEDVRQMVG